MRHNRSAILISLLTGIISCHLVTPLYALGNALTGEANVASGAKSWSNNCARCHNARSSSEFSHPDWQTIMLHMRIQAGITGQEARNIFAFLTGQSSPAPAANTTNTAAAPASTSKTDAKAVDVKNGSVTAQSPSTPAAAAQTTQAKGASGSSVYQQTCIACHGANGKGAIPGAPDFTSPTGPLKKSDAVLLSHIKNGFQSPGSPMAMPPKGGNSQLNDADLKNALSYIRSRFGK